MTLEYKSGETVIYCPFCQKYGVKAFYRAPYKGVGKSRGSGVSNSFNTSHKSDFVVLGDCPHCKKTTTEIQKEV